MPRTWIAALLVAGLAVACERPAKVPSDSSAGRAQSLIAPCREGTEAGNGCVLDVGLVELLANPAPYHGRRVITTGFYSNEFEGHAIYLSGDDYEQFNGRHGLWVSILQPARANYAHLDTTFVRIEGTFYRGPSGHFASWSGRLDSVTVLDSAFSRATLERLKAEHGVE
ncbi:MAG TPA: hypothetical protein VFS94_00145 [Gemmatimonadales bacterium]|nr:hypothetical protein [Gemmatimonadales bacterium]